MLPDHDSPEPPMREFVIRRSSGCNTAIAASKLARLANDMAGTLLLPGDSFYDSVRRVWNGMVDKKPGLIARCARTADAIACVHFAREHDLLVSVRGGGHNYAGASVSHGGMMIDLSTMSRRRHRCFRAGCARLGRRPAR
jgi:FAD/FMN-containing dehydrogenase